MGEKTNNYDPLIQTLIIVGWNVNPLMIVIAGITIFVNLRLSLVSN